MKTKDKGQERFDKVLAIFGWELVTLIMLPFILIVLAILLPISMLHAICREIEDTYRGCHIGEKYGYGVIPQSKKMDKCT